jgi:uncharacterized protein YciI
MLVVRSRYTRPLEEVDALREAHLAWVVAHVEAGSVLAAGRMTPPDGAILLLAGDLGVGAVRDFFASDPYVLGEVAEYEAVGQFTPGLVGPGLDALLG